jgi:activator of HSP90 ATPase
MLTERILKMELNEGNLKIRHTEVKSITGDAEINVRKGK